MVIKVKKLVSMGPKATALVDKELVVLARPRVKNECFPMTNEFYKGLKLIFWQV